MQTVYVPVKASDEMPPDRERISIILDGVYLTAGKNISGAICLDYPAGHVVDEYYDRVTWLKPTEAVLLTKEDADRVKDSMQRLIMAFANGLKLSKDAVKGNWFEQCKEALQILNQSK